MNHFNQGRSTIPFMLAIFSELTAIGLALMCLSRVHSPWWWGLVALSVASFIYLIKRNHLTNARFYSAFGALFLISSSAWFWLNHDIVLTQADWLGVGIALLAIVFMIRSKH